MYIIYILYECWKISHIIDFKNFRQKILVAQIFEVHYYTWTYIQTKNRELVTKLIIIYRNIFCFLTKTFAKINFIHLGNYYRTTPNDI